MTTRGTRLKERNNETRAEFFKALTVRDYSKMQELINMNKDRRVCVDAEKGKPFQIAIDEEDVELLRFLIRNGLNVNILKGVRFASACKKGLEDFVMLILKQCKITNTTMLVGYKAAQTTNLLSDDVMTLLSVNIDDRVKVTKQIKTFEKFVHYCDCNKGMNIKKPLLHTILTDVDEHENCVYCGYAALTVKKHSTKGSVRGSRKREGEAVKKPAYAEEYNIYESGKTGGGVVLSGWREFDRF